MYLSRPYTPVTGNRSSSEESYAGPLTPPRADISTSFPMPAPKRLRRIAGLPDGYPLFHAHDVCIEPDRVGFPSVARLPTWTRLISVDHRYYHLWIDHVSTMVGSLLKKDGIVEPRFNLCHRQWRGHMEEVIKTNLDSPVVLFVTASLPEWGGAESWARTCLALRVLLAQEGWTDIGVEIAVPEIDVEGST